MFLCTTLHLNFFYLINSYDFSRKHVLCTHKLYRIQYGKGETINKFALHSIQDANTMNTNQSDLGSYSFKYIGEYLT